MHGWFFQSTIFLFQPFLKGSFRIISTQGRVEKVVESAHTGAVTAAKWSYDGQSVVTAGEDGAVKVCSISDHLCQV